MIPSARDDVARDPLDLFQPVAEQARRVDVGDGHAEAGPLRPQPVGERDDLRIAAAHDHEPVDLEAFVEALDDRLLVRGLGERRVQAGLEVVDAAQEGEPALARAVGRLEHGGEPDRVERVLSLVDRAHGGELRLRDAGLRQAAAHRDLVRDSVRDVAADPRQAELLGYRGDDRDGAVGGDGDDPVDLVLAPELGERGDVEVADLADVRLREPRRFGVPVGGDDA